jgi:hypothetical protein
MNDRGLDYDFACRSPGSRRWYEIAEAGELDTLRAELERTAAAYATVGQARVDKGLLTPAELQRAKAVIAAIVADFAWNGTLAELKRLALEHGVRWPEKVAWLRSEIETRRVQYRAAVAKGQLTEAQARAQLERLEAVHWEYWAHGFAWDGSRDELRSHNERFLDAVAPRAAA